MFEKLAQLEKKYEELSLRISDPDVISRQAEWKKDVMAHSELEDVVAGYRRYQKLKEEYDGDMELLESEDDPEMRALAEEEAAGLKEELAELEETLKFLLLPKDPNDAKNAIMEFRAAIGGEEAALFANDLFKMYSRYAEKQGWKVEVMNSNITDIGGIKELICLVSGKNAYARLKYESGVHRVQRVPDTETQGRVHTSAATVAVMPEAEEVEVEIGPNDVKTDVFCASGPGGQCVNTTQSAVRLTHLPTGIVVSCQDEKSQLRNKEKAMKILRARIYEAMQREQQGDISSMRKNMVGSGERSERIRTFNFPQGRVTDHRIGLTLHRLDSILEGDLDEIIDALIRDEQVKLLKEGGGA
ncbi:MAG: peptide chain release factor 1 [Bacillota bacterium]|jgi:peptide chain release factor 1